MALAGLYRRVLPSPPAIEFASAEGKKLFSEALQNGTMEGFFKLISYFQTQSEPAYCGLASLSMVLNALAIDPGRKWKGPWRWFDESMLDCCEPLEKVKAEGITFGKVACLAHCAGANVQAIRTSQGTLEDFRQHVIRCTSSDDCHVITSYNRKAFGQTGTGHFSPIGGYHKGSDMALILDTARFKYPPHWVPLQLLWEAMNYEDPATGYPRGFMLISKLQRAPSLLYTLSCRHESWVQTAKYLMDDVPLLLKKANLNTVQDVLSLIFKSLLSNAGDFIKWVAEVRRQEENSALSKEEKERLAIKEIVLQQIRETKLYKYVSEWLSDMRSCCCNATAFSGKDSLTDIAANVCCQGALLLAGNLGRDNKSCLKTTCVNNVKSNGGGPITVVSGTVVSEGGEQGVDMLVPTSPSKSHGCNAGSSSCAVAHPGHGDVLTILSLALFTNSWFDINNKKLLDEIHALVSFQNLPDVLQEEVLHLRRQLMFLKKCKDKEVDGDVLLPSMSMV